MRKVTCMCESSFEADLPEEIDLDAESGRIDDILAGKFFAIRCPSCGAELKPELRVRLRSKERNLDLQLVPELERQSVYLGQASLPKGAEALVGFTELYERAMLLKAGVDPETVEIIKYWLLEKAAEKEPDAEISIRFSGIEGDKLTFHLGGLRQGETAVLHVGRDLYSRSLADKATTMRNPPFDRIFAGPYKSIRILEFEPQA
jgi:hypothetical protein